jgi:hypothetical protein
MPVMPQPIVTALTSVAKIFMATSSDKQWYKSKTIWASIVAAGIIGGAGFYPPALVIITAAPTLVLPVAGGIVGAVFVVLRLVTGGKITAT